jgi:cytochrome c oxidase assembly protein Cox11
MTELDLDGGHTSYGPANLDHVWKGQFRCKVETYCFEHETLDGEKTLTVLLYFLHTEVARSTYRRVNH